MASAIVVNGRFEGRRLTGVERYASETVRCIQSKVRVVKPIRPMSGLQGHLWEQIVLPRLLGADEFLWCPANTGPLAITRQAVTIHDLSVLEHPEWFNPNFRLWYRLMLPRLVKQAKTILTVSEFSRRSIIRRFELSENSVTVVADGVNLSHFHPTDPTSIRAKYELSRPYILFVGSLDPRKNLERLFQAWIRLAEFQDVDLVIAGAPASIFRPVAVNNPRRRTRFLGYVPDDDLPGLYAGATFFIMPSLFEGFGLTVLEAMACGTPVITSHAGALPEVVGDAAIQIDPTSAEGMAETIRKLLLDEALRAELRRKGLERACQFSWERSAKAIWEVLIANA